MNRLLLPIAIVLSLLAGIGLGAAKWRDHDAHWDARIATILSQAAQMQPGGVLVVGDSITERVRFDTLCGRPALNAGIGSSTAAEWLPDIGRVIAAARPSIVILALGTNGKGDWRSAYRELAKRADFAVAPTEPAKAAFVRSVIRAVPGPNSTVDGIHPDAKGARQWLQAVESGCH